MSRHSMFVALILATSVLHQGFTSRILGVFPLPSISHQVVYRGLTLALRERGHELVIVTTDPVNDPTLTNYTEIDVSILYGEFNKNLDWVAHRETNTWLESIQTLAPKFIQVTETVLGHPELKKLYSTNRGEKFDLLLIEMLVWPALFALGERLDVPVIGMSSLGLNVQMHYGIGNPIMPSHPSHWDAKIQVIGKLTFWQRLQNFVQLWTYLYWYRTDYLQAQQATARKYLGKDISDIGELEKNVSLVFVNQQSSISFVRPNIPRVIDIGGFHMSKETKPLSEDLQKILDKATEGFIYMSLGTNVKSIMLSNETRGEFIAAFSRLPYIVIWKFEGDVLPGQPENVIIMKWAPQQSILAHPNIKAFIYQGGLQSTEEAISHAVPVIGLPVLADQDTLVNKMVSLGVGRNLNILSVNRENLLEAIRSVVLDNGYKQRMINLRDLIRDKPYDSLENAVWWTEHVIRHKGAPHLHSTIADAPWYQRQDMDLIFIISSATFIALIITLGVSYKFLVYSIHLLNHDRQFISKQKKSKTVVGKSRCDYFGRTIMSRYLISVTLILAIGDLHQVYAARILGIFPMPSLSHQVVFRGLTLALRERGHELVVVTPNPINDPTLKNYTEVDVSFLYDIFNKETDWIAGRNEDTWLGVLRRITPIFMTMTEGALGHSEVRKLYAPNSGEKFDLMLIEMLYWPAYLPLAKRFDVPVVGMASLSLSVYMQYGIGNPIMASHPSNWDCGAAVLGDLTFWQRLKNFVRTWRFLYWYRTDYMQKQQEIARKYFGNDIPDIGDVEKNISLVFVNQQTPITFVRPNIPNIVGIGGFHVSNQSEPLSKDLQRTLDEATQGFIYMSLGSNVKSATLSKETRGEFIAAFSKLPYIVIWKFESDFLPDKPDNVFTVKWAPQQSILAHPNIKAFIYQGGLQSTEEAVSYAVPVIGLPVFADQDTQVDKMVSLGVGKQLEILTVNRVNLVETIESVVTDSSYKERMLKLRDLMEDKPYDSLENAVWWTEHVIRHKGAPHLHSTTADDPWYQQQNMDLIFIISSVISIALITALVVLYKVLVHSVRLLSRNHLPVDQKDKVC
ncbi:uncharacterized protein LOC124309473 [Neodiprion virginianus]|uniref:uncharacterized protein LOC124309473 n=1 Tax=Neodiprion virginianus TaxID=2961670 RepID=UPI001EE6E4F7|nr:uncharacterized protein LOC124309473 [Neodiprion virginianus]